MRVLPDRPTPPSTLRPGVHPAQLIPTPLSCAGEGAVIVLDELRTAWHERAVVVAAKRDGKDPGEALAQSRRLRARFRNDLRLPIRAAMRFCERGRV